MMSKLLIFIGKMTLPLLISLTCTRSDSAHLAQPPAPPRLDTTVTAISSVSIAHRIAFSSDRDRCFYFDIYTMNSDGSDVQRLTQDLADDKTPA